MGVGSILAFVVFGAEPMDGESMDKAGIKL